MFEVIDPNTPAPIEKREESQSDDERRGVALRAETGGARGGEALSTSRSGGTPPQDGGARGGAALSNKNKRTCAGCGKHAAPEELVRVVLDPSSGEIAVDLASSGFGRGAHVHGTPDCLAKALKSGFSRVFKTKVVGEVTSLGASIVTAADRRIEGLLSGAHRARQLAIGSDVTCGSLKEGRAELVVVARDAAAATKLPEIERAILGGKAIAFAEKARLGSLFGKEEIAVLAVLHKGVASAVSQTFRLSGPFRTPNRTNGDTSVSDDENRPERGSEEAWSSSEVR